MKELQKYDLGIIHLSNKRHDYEFELRKPFFDLFDQPIINGGEVDVSLVLDKSELLITMSFHLKGELNLTCDRTLEEFSYPVDTRKTLIVRYGNEETELDEDMIQITHDTSNLNIAQHLLDYLVLAVPIKKLHPRCLAEDAALELDDAAEVMHIFSTGSDRDESDDNPDEGDEPTDPRWDALRKMK